MRHRPDRLFLLTGFVQGLAFAWGLAGDGGGWVVDLRLSPFRLAVLGTALVLSILMAETPTGVIADLYSRKYSVVAAYVVMGTAMALGPVTELFGVLLVWQVLWGIGWTLQSGAATAWMTDELAFVDRSHRIGALPPVVAGPAPHHPAATNGESAAGNDDGDGNDSDGNAGRHDRVADQLIVRHAMWRSIGVMVGLAAATAMGAWSIRGSMAAMGVLAIAAAGYLAIAMPEAGFEPPRGRRHGAAVPPVQRTSAWRDAVTLWKRGARLVRRNPSLLAVTVSAAIAAGAWEANDRLSALRLFDLGLSQFDGREAVLFFGAAWFAMSALAIPMMMWLHRHLERSEADEASARRDAFLLARFLVIASAGAFALALSPWFRRGPDRLGGARCGRRDGVLADRGDGEPSCILVGACHRRVVRRSVPSRRGGLHRLGVGCCGTSGVAAGGTGNRRSVVRRLGRACCPCRQTRRSRCRVNLSAVPRRTA